MKALLSSSIAALFVSSACDRAVPWTDLPEHKAKAFNDRPFESALAKFVKEVGTDPWSPRN
jgi:hypothetical protein